MGIIHLVSQFHIGASTGPSDFVQLWASPGRGDSGPHLDITRTGLLWSPSGIHLELGTLVLNWTSTGPGESTPHLGLVWTL